MNSEKLNGRRVQTNILSICVCYPEYPTPPRRRCIRMAYGMRGRTIMTRGEGDISHEQSSSSWSVTVQFQTTAGT
jgi:hypothetical protein